MCHCEWDFFKVSTLTGWCCFQLAHDERASSRVMRFFAELFERRGAAAGTLLCASE